MPKTARLSPRAKLVRALHAEARKRGWGHADLHDEAAERFGAASISALSDEQIKDWFLAMTGRMFRAKHSGIADKRRRQAAGTAGRKTAAAKTNVVHLASADDVELLYQVAYKIGWDKQRLKGFIRRQLKGRETIRTLADLNKVLWPLKRMARAARN